MSAPLPDTPADASRTPLGSEVAFGEAMWLWAKVGFLSFGGAAGQIAMLHRFIVDERRWLDERGFLDALNFCTLLPVPEWSSLRPDMLALSLLAGVLLFRFRVGVVATVAAMAAAGLTLMLLRG